MTNNNTIQNKNIITISGMTKKFGKKVVLSDISLSINRGDSIAFVGRNGCGKSTVLKIIAGVMPFEKGRVTHNGKLIFGYVPERFPAINLTVKDYISQIGAVAGLRKNELMKRSAQLFEAFFMNDMVDTPVRYLSKGTIQKVAVIQAFLQKPDVLILDEPVSGQDAASQLVFIDMVNNLISEHDVTVLMSCHEDNMINAIARTVYEIAGGKLRERERSVKSDTGNLCKLLFGILHENEESEASAIPETVGDVSAKIEILENREVMVYAAAEESNKVICEMLNNGFILKEINNERII